VANVVSSTTLSENPQRFGFSCGRVPLRQVSQLYNKNFATASLLYFLLGGCL